MKKIFFCFFILIFACNSSEKVSNISLVEVINPDFNKIVDGIIDFEKRCDYYSNDEIFIFSFIKKNDILYFKFGSIGNTIYDISERERYCFERQGHLFIIWGTDISDLNNLLKKTGKYKKILLDRHMPIFDDNSFSAFYYIYRNDKFYLTETYTLCD